MIRDIFNTYKEAFRQWVRSRTRPKTMHEAEEKKLFWSKCYLLSATGVIGVYLFELYKENINFGNDKKLSKSLQLAKGLNQEEPLRIIKYSGFKKVSDKTIDVKELDKDTILMEEITAPKVS